MSPEHLQSPRGGAATGGGTQKQTMQTVSYFGGKESVKENRPGFTFTFNHPPQRKKRSSPFQNKEILSHFDCRKNLSRMTSPRVRRRKRFAKSKTLAQGGFISPEHFQSPRGEAATGGGTQKRKTTSLEVVFLFWSGRRGSNSLPRPWQGRALPDELRSQTHKLL